jgi:hypothetical protein
MTGVGRGTGYWLDGLGSIPGSARFFSSSQRPDRLWGPPNFLYNGYRGHSPREVKRQGREADHSLLVPRSIKVELYLHSPILLKGIVLTN